MDVIIDGEYVDSGESIISVTKQGYDFTDLLKRFVGRTNRFSIKKTSAGQQAFGVPEDIATKSKGFETSYNCDITDEGVIVIKGFAILAEAGDKYNIQVVDRAKVLFDLLEADLNLIDVEDSDFIFGFGAEAVLNQPNSTVWIWGADCQHIEKKLSKTIFEYNPSVPGSQDVRYSRPHFNVREIIDRIFSDKGWEFTDFDGSDKLDAAIITSNHKEFYVTSYEKNLVTYYGAGNYTLGGLDGYVFKQDDVDVTPTTIDIKGQEAAFRLRGPVTVIGNWEITFTATSSPNGDDVTVQSFGLNDTDTSIDFTTDIFKTDEASNIVSITISGSGSGAVLDMSSLKLYNIIKESSFANLSTNPLQGFKVKTYDNLLDITQMDFMRQIWAIFGVGININQVEKKIIPFAYRNFSRDILADWSGKYVDESINVSSPMLSGRTNYFVYDNDETLPSLDGSGTVFADNDNLPDFYEAFRSYFSASQQITIQGNDVFINYYFTVSYLPIYNDTGRENVLNPRILLYRPGTGFPNFGVGTFFSSFTSSVPSESPEGISFKNILDNDYAEIVKAIKKNRLIRADFILNKLDVISFDFSKMMYCEELKSFFFVIKIDNFIPGRATSCEILKLN